MPDLTQLSPEDEALFLAWAKQNGIKDVDHPASFYDYRGFWKDKPALSAWKPGDHFPDTYKQHGHPTFSQESAYSKGPSDGGMWVGEKFLPQPPMAPSHEQDDQTLLRTLLDKLMRRR